MRILVDASCDARIAVHLRRLGHDVTRIGRDYPGNLEDAAVLVIALSERRILITDDCDFGELVFRLRQPHAGVIYLRLETTRIDARAGRLEAAIANVVDGFDQFLVVDMAEIRVRPNPTVSR